MALADAVAQPARRERGAVAAFVLRLIREKPLGAFGGAVFLVFLFCGGISLLAGLPFAGAFAIGAYTAFWGGPGFGGMMGATVYYSFHTDEF